MIRPRLPIPSMMFRNWIVPTLLVAFAAIPVHADEFTLSSKLLELINADAAAVTIDDESPHTAPRKVDGDSVFADATEIIIEDAPSGPSRSVLSDASVNPPATSTPQIGQQAPENAARPTASPATNPNRLPFQATASPTDISADVAAVSFNQLKEEEKAAYEIDDAAISEISYLRSEMAALNRQVGILHSRTRSTARRTVSVGPPRFYGTMESVLMQATPSNMTGLIVETAGGGYSHVMFPWKILHSPRVSFGYDPGDDTLGWRVQFWQFRHNDQFAANASNGLLPVGMEGTVGFLSEDGDITTGLAFIEEGVFRSSIRADVLDWELQRRLTRALNFFAGLRYAKVKQNYSATTDRGNLNSYSQFRGIGPSLALVFEHVLPLDRLTLFSVARGSMLFGQRRFGVVDDVNNMPQSIGVIDIRSGDDGANAMAGNVELQIGVRYEVRRWLTLKVALEAQQFMDVGGANPTAVFAGPDSGLAGDSPLDDDLSLFGLNVAATFAY